MVIEEDCHQMNKPVVYEEDCYNYSYGSYQNENISYCSNWHTCVHNLEQSLINNTGVNMYLH